MNFILILLCTVVPYIIGSVNTSLIMDSISGKEDIRTKGSGNAGATNVLRHYGWKMAALVFLGDGIKGALAVIIVRLYTHDAASPAVYAAAIFVVLGHIFPLFFGFRGGKGVATSICALAALHNGLIIFAILVGMAVVFICITKIMSLSVLLTTLTYTFWVWVVNRGTEYLKYNIIYAIVITIIVFITHRDNISRLLHGTERKLGKTKK